MGMEGESGLLTLLEEFSSREGLAVLLHVFSENKQVGNVLLSEEGLLHGDDLSPDLYFKLENYLTSKVNEFSGLGVFEFSLEYKEMTVRVIGESLETAHRLLIFGAGHVGQAVAMMGAIAGYDVMVVDDRAEFLTEERFPDRMIQLVEGKYDRIRSDIKITKNTAVVIVTRGHQYDEICLEQVLETGVRYIGMIGSRRRVLSIFNRLEARGISRSALESVHAPIGVKIGAVSPQEIAVAILAEIISVMNGYTLDQTSGRRG
ncbi:MAG TPA: XdhC family protein [Blastocatellia bacterium]|nr:XdhC family protein [Blastocatellia bacterium]